MGQNQLISPWWFLPAIAGASPLLFLGMAIAISNSQNPVQVVSQEALAGWTWDPKHPERRLEELTDNQVAMARDILVWSWQSLNNCLDSLARTGKYEPARRIIILPDYMDEIILGHLREVRTWLEGYAGPEIMDKITLPSNLMPTPLPPDRLEISMDVERRIDEARSMIHDGIRILDKEMSRRTYLVSSKEELLGATELHIQDPQWFDIYRYGSRLAHISIGDIAVPIMTTDMRKCVDLDLGSMPIDKSKIYARIFDEFGCKTVNFHTHDGLYHPHLICPYPETPNQRRQVIEGIRSRLKAAGLPSRDIPIEVGDRVKILAPNPFQGKEAVVINFHGQGRVLVQIMPDKTQILVPYESLELINW